MVGAMRLEGGAAVRLKTRDTRNVKILGTWNLAPMFAMFGDDQLASLSQIHLSLISTKR